MNSLDREAQSGVPRDKGEAASAAASGSAGSQGTKFPDESLLWGFTEETLRSRCLRGTWQGLATARHCLQGLGLKHAEQAAALCLTPPLWKGLKVMQITPESPWQEERSSPNSSLSFSPLQEWDR